MSLVRRNWQKTLTAKVKNQMETLLKRVEWHRLQWFGHAKRTNNSSKGY